MSTAASCHTNAVFENDKNNFVFHIGTENPGENSEPNYINIAMHTRNPIIDSGAEISVCPRGYATQFVTSRRPCKLHIYAANGARMNVYDEIMVRATVLDSVGRRVAVSLSFVEADVCGRSSRLLRWERMG